MAAEAILLWRELARSPTQPLLWLTLARNYAALGLPWQAGYSARQAHRLDAASGPALLALEIGPWQDAAAGDGQLGHAALPQAPRLVQRFCARVQESPDDWLTWLYLARLQEMPPGCLPAEMAETAEVPRVAAIGALAAEAHGAVKAPGGTASQAPAAQALQRAIALEPIAGESLHWMGVWRLQAGDAAHAVEAFSALLEIRPVRCGSMMYLGEALLRSGRIEAAQKAFTRASLSTNPDFLLTLAARVYAHNYWQEALAVLQKALALRRESVPILMAMARIQSEVYLLADCRQSLRRVQELAPGHAEAGLLEAGLHGRMGDAKAHLEALQAAYAAGGDPRSRLASSIAMTALYHDAMAPDEVATLHRRLCAPIEAALARKAQFANGLEPERRLRIGFITGDLHRQHPVSLFMLPVLLRLDHARFQVSVYHTGLMHDDCTRQAREAVDRWHEAAAMDDPALQQLIAADGIDLLIDLAGHTASHRLGLFAMRAAPVQATFLGYPHSTGLTAIDWLIGDTIVSPAEHADLFSEGIAQLPGCVFCWAPVDSHPLPAPRPRAAPVVFGSFNNAMKLSPITERLWAAVLQAVPDAQLLLKAPSLRDGAVCRRLLERFAAQGIAPERLSLRGPSGLETMMQEYGDVDIGLDPMPYNGGTTTLQALWMGVPVITLAGGNFVSRMGASFLHALDEPAWVATDAAGYVTAAARLARQVREDPAWRSGRAQRRARMAASPLCNIDAYVGHLQALLRRMWRAHCEGSRPRLLAPMGDDEPAHPTKP